jgi:hypothetical protein
MDKQQAAIKHAEKWGNAHVRDVTQSAFIAGWEAHEAQQSQSEAVAFVSWIAESEYGLKPNGRWVAIGDDETEGITTAELYKLFNPSGAAPAFECPSCGKPWDTSKHNACECGATVSKLPTPPAAGPVWVKGAPPFGRWFAWVQWDKESLVRGVVTTCESANGLFYVMDDEKILPEQIIEYLSHTAPAQQLFTREQMIEAYHKGMCYDREATDDFPSGEEYMETNYPLSPTPRTIQSNPTQQINNS